MKLIRILIVTIILGLANNAYAGQTLTYHLSILNPHTHYAEVKMEIRDLKKDFLDIKMPVWIPGSYMVREFPRNVEGFMAMTVDGDEIRSEKISKNTWRVYSKKKSEVIISYQVYAFEYSVRTTYIDEDHASINPSSLFMFIDGHLDMESLIKIEAYPDWKRVTTTLAHIDNDPFLLKSNNYDELADSPIELGNHKTFEVNTSGVRHIVAMIGEVNYDESRLKSDLKRIIDKSTEVFGEHPCEMYVFFLHHTHFRNGGLEHANSTSIIITSDVYESDNGYSGFLNLVAHEYFHLWNVKRIKPTPLGPFDYDRENYSHLLWHAEGFTSYYDELIMLRAGYDTPDGFLRGLSGSMNYVVNSPGNTIQSVSEASFDAWIKYYKTNENSSNVTISYYTKGKLIAACLDLFIMHHSQGKYRLDDVMQDMYNDFYKKSDKAFTSEDLRKSLEKFAGNGLSDFFEKHIFNANPIPYNEFLNYAGLFVIDQSASGNSPSLGINFDKTNGSLTVKSIRRNSSAWNSLLNVNDEILAVNGEKATENLLKKKLEKSAVGDQWELVVSRHGRIINIFVNLQKNDRKRFSITKMEEPGPLQSKIYELWLGSKF